MADDYVILRRTIMRSAFNGGRCTIDRTHELKKGKKIAKVEHDQNPFLPVRGWACHECIAIYPHKED